jgi:predicted 3-demethylubiquinone-9 3-methyltransferase (glyoxalase superfamily)
MQRITTFLWFDGQAEEAAEFYTSIFDNSEIIDIQRYGESGPGEPGSVMIVKFELDGQQFIALNGGPRFTFTEAISLSISCRSQEEVDRYWDQLVEGGEPSACGWLKDRYGLSWQVVPTALIDMISSPDTPRAQQAMKAMFEMSKIDVPTLEAAYNA